MADQEVSCLDRLPLFSPIPIQPDVDLPPPSKGIYDGDNGDDLFPSVIGVSTDRVRSELKEGIDIDPSTEAPLTSPTFDQSPFCLPETEILELLEYYFPSTEAPGLAGPIDFASVDPARPARQRPPPKRKLHDSPLPLPKRTKRCKEVNIGITRAYLESDNNSTDEMQKTQDIPNIPNISKRLSRPRMRRKNSNSEARLLATIRRVKLLRDGIMYEFSWKRRPGIWEELSKESVLDLDTLDLKSCAWLEVFVYDDGATAWLTWSQKEELFQGPDLIVPRTFRLSLGDARSMLLKPDESRPID